MVEVRGKTDSAVDAIKGALEAFSQKHAEARASVYRYNSGSIRLRIVSDAFKHMNDVLRHDYVWPYLEPLEEDVVSQISIMVLLTPEEVAAKDSIMNLEFDHPSKTRF